MHAPVHAGRLNRCTRILVWIPHPLNPDLDPLSAGVSVRRLGRYTRTLLFILFFGSCFVWLPFSVVVLLASFLRGTLLPFFVLVRVCAGDCVSWPFICVCLLWLSLFVGCPLASVLFLWFSLRCAAGFFCLFCFSCCCCFLSSVRLLCLFLFLVLGVVAVLPALSCCPLLPHPPWLVLWCLLVQSVLCWSLPPGIWLYLQRPGCHTFGLVCCG